MYGNNQQNNPTTTPTTMVTQLKNLESSKKYIEVLRNDEFKYPLVSSRIKY